MFSFCISLGHFAQLTLEKAPFKHLFSFMKLKQRYFKKGISIDITDHCF